MPAEIYGGEVRVRIDGGYLTEALKACGGMVDFKLTDGKSPVLFTVDGYQLVVMPMVTGESQKPSTEAEAKPEPEVDKETEAKAETIDNAEAATEAEAVVKADSSGEPVEPKPKRSRKREKVAVA